MSRYPQPLFDHLVRLSDDTGLLEHARGPIPLRTHGYCVDDVARGLVVICREPTPGAVLIGLAERYLSFLMHAQAADGSFHNRFSYDRRWLDRPDTGDWWGRAIWGLGTAASRAPGSSMRDTAFMCFELAAHHRSRWPRAMTFAGLGAAEILRVMPEHEGARRLLADAVTTIGPAGKVDTWPWPEPRLTYANAALADVILAAGQYLGDAAAVESGLRCLDWLLETETRDGHLSPTPVGGWGPGEPRPTFDQQPIEAAAMADACARAWAMTGASRWVDGLHLAIGWFLGDNDGKAELANWATGGSGDGLGQSGRSLNEGAESTLALLSTLQHGRQLLNQPRGV
jgi:hypothetical protein